MKEIKLLKFYHLIPSISHIFGKYIHAYEYIYIIYIYNLKKEVKTLKVFQMLQRNPSFHIFRPEVSVTLRVHLEGSIPN